MSSNDVYKTMISQLKLGVSSIILTAFENANNKADIKKHLLNGNTIESDLEALNVTEKVKDTVLQCFKKGEIKFIETEKMSYLIEPAYPEKRLIIFGGGHISLPLVEMAKKIGFEVIVFDDRPFFANTKRFPMADHVICDDFEHGISQFQFTSSDFVVLVTRGHRYDIACLKGILGKTLTYIGMIGSKRRVKGIKDTLTEEGFSQDVLDSMYSPIGLDIGAITPEEIAISILGEVITVFRNPADQRKWPEFEKGVYEEHAQSESVYKALATIISKKGSVPRGVGAKMLIAPDGRILGSVGGGCSEGEVITQARDIIINGGHCTYHVDMTAEIAEEEGMVCGGVLEVLIESL